MGSRQQNGKNLMALKVVGSYIKHQTIKSSNLWCMKLCQPMMLQKGIQWIGFLKAVMMGAPAGIFWLNKLHRFLKDFFCVRHLSLHQLILYQVFSGLGFWQFETLIQLRVFK